MVNIGTTLEEKMILSHGTSLEHFDDIVRRGILNRELSGVDSNFEEYPSAMDRVYLSNCYSPYFAMMHSSPMIVEVEIDEDRLYPDEDFLSQVNRDVENTLQYRDEVYGFQHLWKESLEHLGTVACVGWIRPDQIVSIWSFEESLLAVCDPMINLMNHQIMGEYYTKLTSWFLGSDDYPRAMYGGPDDDRLIRWFNLFESKRKCLYRREVVTPAGKV